MVNEKKYRTNTFMTQRQETKNNKSKYRDFSFKKNLLKQPVACIKTPVNWEICHKTVFLNQPVFYKKKHQ